MNEEFEQRMEEFEIEIETRYEEEGQEEINKLKK